MATTVQAASPAILVVAAMIRGVRRGEGRFRELPLPAAPRALEDDL